METNHFARYYVKYNMMKLLIGIVCIALSMTLSSCGKEKSNRWVVGDIQIVDESTGLPVKSKITLAYSNVSSVLSTTDYEIELGDTDSQGRIQIEHEISRNASKIHLEIRSKTGYYNYPWQIGGVTKEQPLQIQGANALIVKLRPLYPYTLYFHNTSCSGPTDTLWCTSNIQPHIYTGCVDTSALSMYGMTWILDSPVLNLDMTSKKAGLVTSWNESVILTHGALTEIQIDY
jgi:hypothetical protein